MKQAFSLLKFKQSLNIIITKNNMFELIFGMSEIWRFTRL